jgi:hypothetical protein
MAGSFTITISSLSALNIGGTKRAELMEIADMVERSMQAFVSSNGATTAFKDRQGNSAGSISWTPVNST